MRESELLHALSRQDPGFEMRVARERVALDTLYHPRLHEVGTDLFQVALAVAKQMIDHPDCPPEVKEALEAYNRHSQGISL